MIESLIVLIILIIFYTSYNPYKVKFLKKDDVIDLVMGDSDDYVKNMNTQDYRDRGCSNGLEYKIKYFNAISELSDHQKEVIEECVTECVKFLKNVSSPFIENNLIVYETPWKLIMLEDHIEDKRPHTRKDVIFVPRVLFMYDKKTIIKTLIHEKVHVYQRLHRNVFKKSLKNSGFTILNRNIRFHPNPDIDNIMYRHPDGYVMKWTPERFFDHPNELVAYMVEEKY